MWILSQAATASFGWAVMLLILQASDTCRVLHALLPWLRNTRVRKMGGHFISLFSVMHLIYYLCFLYLCESHLLKKQLFFFARLQDPYLTSIKSDCLLVGINKICCLQVNILDVWHVSTVLYKGAWISRDPRACRVLGLRFLFLLLSCGVRLESISRDGDLWSRSLGTDRNWILDVIPSPVIGKWKARTTKVTIPLLKRKRSERKVCVCFPPVFFLIPSLTSPPLSIPLYYDIQCSNLYFWDIVLCSRVLVFWLFSNFYVWLGINHPG